MISIIICSRTKSLKETFKKNIEDTIGCEYELIVIDNSQNKYSIFEAYNSGIEKSSGEYLCFIHDDILMHTIGWGTKLQEIFNENEEIGLIGVAGTKIKTKMPSAWWECPKNKTAVNIIQHHKVKEKEIIYHGFDSNDLIEVAVVDGVFIAIRNKDELKFNDELKGFHNYDIDISLKCIEKGYKVYVTNQLLIEHFSSGTVNEKWVKSTFDFYKLNKDKLPINVGSNKLDTKLENLNAIRFITNAVEFKKHKIAYTIWLKLLFTAPFLKFHLQFLKSKLKKIF
ncbi:MAG: hypothetical protein COA67_00565 [Lutibacter sp.]|nr:MAG: hypothetical protein COA67_00565 [Lutibacter sp.]